VHEAAVTLLTPDAGTSTASRQSLFTGEATRRAARKLKDALGGRALSALRGRASTASTRASPTHRQRRAPPVTTWPTATVHVVIMDEAAA
jgi:xanthine dehydrogenase molybdenum-binding subunit